MSMTSSILDQLRLAFPPLDEDTCIHDIIEAIQGRIGSEAARERRRIFDRFNESMGCGHKQQFLMFPFKSPEELGQICMMCAEIEIRVHEALADAYGRAADERDC